MHVFVDWVPQCPEEPSSGWGLGRGDLGAEPWARAHRQGKESKGNFLRRTQKGGASGLRGPGVLSGHRYT